MEISSLGANLSILIPCDYSLAHDWMSFVCWYSISKNLPEASVMLVCNRKQMNLSLFSWTKKCKVPCIFHKDTDLFGQINVAKRNNLGKTILVIEPDTVCVRDFDETKIKRNDLNGIILGKDDSDVLSDCKDSEISLFVSYREGWGTFVCSNWINKESCPLISSLDFKSLTMTINESRLRKIWNSAIHLYHNVSRG